MRTGNDELWSPSEAAVVVGMSLKSVYKSAAERLPKTMLVRRGNKLFLTRSGLVCLRVDREIPKSVPVNVRNDLYRQIRHLSGDRAEYGVGVFRYVIDTESAREAVDTAVDAYRQAMSMIVEHPDIQGGAATVRGTRILAHQVADLLAQGVSEAELIEDYPRLSPEAIEACRIFARSHPRRGRPRKPGWQLKPAPADPATARPSR